jgi:hypothetical protein
MAQAVVPVVAEVVEDEGEDPHPEAAGIQREQRQMLPGEGVGQQADDLGHQAGSLRQDTGAETVEGIGQAVGAHAAPAVGEQLQADQEKEEGHRIEDVIHDCAISLYLCRE